jgi:ATP-dependent DNA helicase DinG
MSDTVGVTIAPSRFVALAAVVRRILDDPALIASVIELSELLGEAIGPLVGQRLPTPLPDRVREFLGEARTRLGRIGEALSAIDTQIEDAKQRKLRAQTMTGRLIEHLETAIAAHDGYVDFVSGSPEWPRLEIAPLDVGPKLQEEVWGDHVAILTSATIPASLADRVGLPSDGTDIGRRRLPVRLPANALLYCARHLPDPRSEKYRPAVHEELAALITAAGGRTLALFTSWRAMDEAAAAVRAVVPYTILTQRDLPKPALVRAFAADAETCLFATAGLFQGVDVQGRRCRSS